MRSTLKLKRTVHTGIDKRYGHTKPQKTLKLQRRESETLLLFLYQQEPTVPGRLIIGLNMLMTGPILSSEMCDSACHQYPLAAGHLTNSERLECIVGTVIVAGSANLRASSNSGVVAG